MYKSICVCIHKPPSVRPLTSKWRVTHNVCHGVDLGPGVHDVELLGVLVGGGDGSDVALVLPAPPTAGPHQGLAAAGDGGVRDWVEPGEHLHEMGGGAAAHLDGHKRLATYSYTLNDIHIQCICV